MILCMVREESALVILIFFRNLKDIVVNGLLKFLHPSTIIVF